MSSHYSVKLREDYEDYYVFVLDIFVLFFIPLYPFHDYNISGVVLFIIFTIIHYKIFRTIMYSFGRSSYIMAPIVFSVNMYIEHMFDYKLYKFIMNSII